MKKKILKFLNYNKGYLLSCLAVLAIYPIGFLMQNQRAIHLDEFAPLVPITFLGMLLISLPIRFILREDKK